MKTKNKTPTFSFGKESKDNKVRNFTPGVGSYNRSTDNLFGKDVPKYTMGKTERNNNLSSNLNTSMGNLTTKGLNNQLISTPGPGHYSIDISVLEKSKKKTPSFQMGKSTRDFNYYKGGVGPAYYTPNVTSGKAHQYTMNKTKREDLMSKDRILSMKSVPGVGQYNLTPKTWEGPKTTIQGKKNINYDNKIPGPGSYENNKSVVMKKNPGVKMGTAKRDNNYMYSKSNLNTPGAGMYSVKSDFDLIGNKSQSGFKFGKEPKNKSLKNNTPAPGQYYIPCSLVNVPTYSHGKFDKTFKWV